MSENIKMEDLQEQVDSTSETTEQVEATEVEQTEEATTTQDPLKTELEKVQRKSGKSELEKASKSLFFNAQKVKELGGDPNIILGVKANENLDDDDDAPVTLGMLKKLQQESAQRSAVQLAEDIENETERELTKYHLENTIKSTGNPKEDLKLARAIVNSVKNSQVVEEIARKPIVKNHSNSSSAPAKDTEVQGDLTSDELAFMKPPFNLTKEQILKSRK